MPSRWPALIAFWIAHGHFAYLNYMNPDGLTAAKRAGEPLSSKGVRSVGSTCMLSFVMNSLAWLGLAVLITAVAAITGIKPKGTRHVAHTRLMGVARFALLALVIIFAYLAFRGRTGG